MDLNEPVSTVCFTSSATDPVSVFRTEVRNISPARRKTSAIHKCVITGDYEGLKRILSSKKRETINDCDHFGRTALQIAMQMADPKALYLLLYYPFVHPSKIFATQDWDFILGKSISGRKRGRDVEVVCDGYIQDSFLDGKNGNGNVSRNDGGDLDSVCFDDSGEYDFVSTGIRGKVNENTEKGENAAKAKRAGTSWHIGPYLLRHWESSPSNYLHSAFGVDSGAHVFGCGLKEVESLYEDHYNFLVGSSHNLERSVRNYSSKYARMYSNHPINLPHVMELLKGLETKIYTKINITAGNGETYQTISISTYLSTQLDETKNVTNSNDSQEGMNENRHNVNQMHLGAHDNATNLAVPHLVCFPENVTGNVKAKRVRFHEMWGESRTPNVSTLPLVMCDLEATYDKTPLLHLLFSNIYIKSYRPNIYRCFRILLHYFNTFNNRGVECNTYGSSLYGFNRISKSCEASRVVQNTLATPMSSTTNGQAPLHFTSDRLYEPKKNVGNCVVSQPNIASSYAEKSFNMVNNLTKRQKVHPPTDVQTQFSRRGDPGDGDRSNSYSNVTNAEMDMNNSSKHIVHPLISSGHKVTQGIAGARESRKTSDTLKMTANNVVDVGVQSEMTTGECINSGRESPTYPLKDPTMVYSIEKNAPISNANNTRGHYNITKTVCLDVNSMGNNARIRGLSAIGSVQHDSWKNRHQSSFEIPVTQTNCVDNSGYMTSESVDPEIQVLGRAIVSSGWLKPTVHWDKFLNSRDYTRSNLLHKVCQIKDVELIKWLLSCGCQPLIVNEVGDLPVHLAMDTNDPMCVITMLHATFSALFYHRLDVKQGTMRSSKYRISPKFCNHLKCGEDSLFEKYMKRLAGSSRVGASSNIIHSDQHVGFPIKQHFCGGAHNDEINMEYPKTRTGMLHCNIEGLCLLTPHDNVILFEEMLALMEQLTYRAIKSGSWEGLIAIYSYNETISRHFLIDPYYMHRFINMAVLVGNSEEFMAAINFLASTNLKPDSVVTQAYDRRKHNEATNGVRNVTVAHSVVSEIYRDGQNSGNDDCRSLATALHSTKSKINGGTVSNSSSDVNVSITTNVNGSNQCKAFYGKWGPCSRVRSMVQSYRACGSKTSEARNSETWVITHPTCLHHLALPEPTDMPSRRHKLIMTFPENPTRLEVIISNENGILRSDTLENVKLLRSPPPATLADILRVHDWGYIESLLERVQLAQSKWVNNPYWPILADDDTPTTPHSWNSALYAAGSVLAAVDAVCTGQCRNAFCAVRPPGHHLGTWGGAQSGGFEDEDFAAGSQGFCLINNVAVGAAYAKYMYAKKGIRKIAIVDFDIHHGNGTHQIVMNIGPRNVQCRHGADTICLDPNATKKTHPLWFGWRDVRDKEDVFFSSIHAYDGIFYPGTGKSCARYNASEPRIINVGIPQGTTSAEFRILFETKILPYLLYFSPDLIFISAGFDGHYRDSVSSGFVSYKEKDFYWATERLVSVANTVCKGRVISVLEGGYNTRLDTLSPFAKSVFEHVKALTNTNGGYKYPFMHSRQTIDLLLSPLVFQIYSHRSSNPSGMQCGNANLSITLGKISSMRKAIGVLLAKVYSIEGLKYCKFTKGAPKIATNNLTTDAISLIGNALFSLYSKHFESLFVMADEDSRQHIGGVSGGVSKDENDVITFDRFMGTEYDTKPSATLFDDRLSASSLSLQTILSASDGDVHRLLLTNPWSLDIKMKSLERHVTSAALLWSYFKTFGRDTGLRCNVHC
ncbi:histone deacetylase, putative [Babesia ovis]|uniref:Histone deacetylase, putative n=1 Tax=Babesia ovis TaxID=5869 RepID=A0A9W5WWH7_BABOV|nr:histone deacetylase, putative [Babesia ovis]